MRDWFGLRMGTTAMVHNTTVYDGCLCVTTESVRVSLLRVSVCRYCECREDIIAYLIGWFGREGDVEGVMGRVKVGGRGGGEKRFGNFSKRKTDLGQGGLHTGVKSTHHSQQNKHMVALINSRLIH